MVPIPGIGFIAAATVIAEVWEVSRFAHPEQLYSWAGLAPTERSSAEHTRGGHISKQGSRRLRWIVVEAATNHTCRDPNSATSQGVSLADAASRSLASRWPAAC